MINENIVSIVMKEIYGDIPQQIVEVIDGKGINKTKLREVTDMSSSTMAKLAKNQAVALPVLELDIFSGKKK